MAEVARYLVQNFDEFYAYVDNVTTLRDLSGKQVSSILGVHTIDFDDHVQTAWEYLTQDDIRKASRPVSFVSRFNGKPVIFRRNLAGVVLEVEMIEEKRGNFLRHLWTILRNWRRKHGKLDQ